MPSVSYVIIHIGNKPYR